MHGKWVLAALCAAGSLAAQPSDVPADVLLLARIKVKMEETLLHQPNYTCVQRIERSGRHIPKKRYELVDMLRLEVALVGGKEMFAWPGSRNFEDTDLRDMVSGGAIGNGNFALHARAVFLSTAPVFTFKGEEPLDGRKAIRFDFRVPLSKSGYHIRVDRTEAVVAYHGSFWADPASLDVRRLFVQADDIPPALGLDSASDQMDYARIPIGQGDFLLPASSELSMIDLAGNESRNRSRFTACRQYTGQSVLSFAETPEPESEPPRPVSAVERAENVPGNLVAEVELETDIDSTHSMIGDPVEALLEQPLALKHKLLVPKGATLAGRIVQLKHHGDHCELKMNFREAEFAGSGRSPSRWNLVGLIQDVRWPVVGAPVERFERSLFPKSAAGLGTIYIRGDRIHLPRGIRMTLRTMAADRLPDSGADR